MSSRHDERLNSTFRRHIAAGMIACLAVGLSPLLNVTPAQASPDKDKHVYTRQHVDAPIPAWDAAERTLRVKASEKNAEEAILWVPRGWSGTTPRHYFTVPQNDAYSFLSGSGKTWYAAPQNPGRNNTPIWAGIGADGTITENAQHFEDRNYVLDFVDVKGPGRVEAFVESTTINRLWSSVDPIRRTVWNPRHMHHYTLFSHPGRYEINVTAVARSADGATVYSSPVTPIVWQVGGTDPRQSLIKDYGAAYNSSRAQRPDGLPQGGTLTVEPKKKYVTAGDERLSDISYTTGNTRDNGRVVLLINGFYLAELPVVNGQAAYDEFLGDENSTLQAIYIPQDDTSARYITTPIVVVPRDQLTVTSVGRATQLSPERPARSPELLPTSHTVEDSQVDVSISPANNGEYTVSVEGDPNLNASVTVSFHADARTDIADCSVEKFMIGGLMESPADLNYCAKSPIMRVKIQPHPYSNAKPQSFELKTPDFRAGQTRSLLTLPLRQTPENHAQPQRLPTFKATPVDDAHVTPPGSGTPQPQNPSNPSLPPVTDEKPQPQAFDTTPVKIYRGHLDLRLHPAQDGKLSIAIKDDSLLGAPKSLLRSPSAVTIQVSGAARSTRNASMSSPNLDFLGPIGSVNYILPELEHSHLPWPGFSTEGIDYAHYPQGITYSLNSKKTPKQGRYLFVTSADLGNTVDVLVDSTDEKKNAIHTTEATHLHGSWVFSKPGRYEMELVARSADKILATAPLVFEVDMERATKETEPSGSKDNNTAPSQNQPGGISAQTSQPDKQQNNGARPGASSAPVGNTPANRGLSGATRGGGSGVLASLTPVASDSSQSADSGQSSSEKKNKKSKKTRPTTPAGTTAQSGLQTAQSDGEITPVDIDAAEEEASIAPSQASMYVALGAVAMAALAGSVLGIRVLRRRI